MDMENKYASRGVGGTALGLAIGALGVEALRGNFGGILGGGNCCGESAPVSRYDAEKSARIAELETEVKLRDANTYTLTKVGELRDYMERKFDCVNASISTQAVVNAQVTANLSCMQGNIATLMGLTKTIIPITNVCPEPMPLYNSYTAPAASA